MRVLENNSEVKATCEKCKSVLAITPRDINYWPNALEPHESEISFKCCVCQKRNFKSCTSVPVEWLKR